MATVDAMIAWLLAAMSLLSPNRDHAELARAIAVVVDSSPPLFRDDVDRSKTLALVTAVAWRESSFRNDAIGDRGRAKCAMQLWNAPVEVLDDPELCVRIGLARLRESLRACGAGNELGVYAAGPNGCASDRAKRISRDRMNLAGWLRRTVTP